MNHYPRIAEIAAYSDLFDLSIFGHTHIYSQGKIKNYTLLNPGSLHPYKIDAPSFVIFSTEDLSLQKVVL